MDEERRVKSESLRWQDIRFITHSTEERSWFEKGIKWKVECGARVRFWEDGWREDGVPLMLKYPKLYINSYQQEQFIQQMGSLLDVSWEWRFQWRRLLFDAERHMAAKFLEDIEGITIYLDRWDK